MSQLTTHNEADKNKEQAQVSKQSRVISTRNVVPYNRPVTKEDVNQFVQKRQAVISAKTNEEIKPAVAKLNDEGRVIENKYIGESFNNFLKDEGSLDEITANAEKQTIDYAAERAKAEEETQPEAPEDSKPKRGRKPKDIE